MSLYKFAWQVASVELHLEDYFVNGFENTETKTKLYFVAASCP